MYIAYCVMLHIILNISCFVEKDLRLVHLFWGGNHKRKPKNNNKKEGGNFVPHNAFTGNFQHLKTSITEEKGINSCWYTEIWQLKDVCSRLLEKMLQAISLAKVRDLEMVGWVDRSQMCWHMEASANAIQPVVQCQQDNDRTGWTPANGHKWWRTTVTSTCMLLIEPLVAHLETSYNCLTVS